MASTSARHKNYKKPWRARVRVYSDYMGQSESHFLGYYATKEEAVEVERQYRESHPRTLRGFLPKR